MSCHDSTQRDCHNLPRLLACLGLPIGLPFYSGIRSLQCCRMQVSPFLSKQPKRLNCHCSKAFTLPVATPHQKGLTLAENDVVMWQIYADFTFTACVGCPFCPSSCSTGPFGQLHHGLQMPTLLIPLRQGNDFMMTTKKGKRVRHAGHMFAMHPFPRKPNSSHVSCTARSRTISHF